MLRCKDLAALPLLVLGVLGLVSPAAAISLGQSDDFEIDAAGWEPGGILPVASGGPGGPGDGYIEYAADGSGGLGKLVVFNESAEWTGDYLSAGVTAISLMANNLSSVAQTFSLRVAIGSSVLSSFPASSGTWYASTVGVTLAPGSGWVPIVFGLDPASMTLVTGSASLDTVLSAVDQLRILSSLSPANRGDELIGTVGLDDITAVPEPSVGALLGLGLAGLGVARRPKGLARPGRS